MTAYHIITFITATLNQITAFIHMIAVTRTVLALIAGYQLNTSNIQYHNAPSVNSPIEDIRTICSKSQ